MVVAAAGFIFLFMKRKVWAWFFLSLYGMTVALYINGPHMEQPIYFIPATLALVIAFGFCIAAVQGYALTGRIIAFAVTVVIVGMLLDNYSLEDLSNRTLSGRRADVVLHAVKRESVILSPNYNWTEILLYKILGEGARKGDDVFVLHHWSPDKLNAYAAGVIDNWDPYAPSGALPERPHLYLLASEETPRELILVRRAGWRAVPVVIENSALVRELRDLQPDRLLLCAVRDEGTPILGIEAFNALKALGLRADSMKGDTFGWAAADAVVRYEDRWCGWQHFRYAPVELRAARGEEIIKTPYDYPADIVVTCAGFGRGDESRIMIDGVRIRTAKRGMNLVFIDRESGRQVRELNVAPSEFHQLSSLYLYELVPDSEL
jgi:hypothetical protein